VITISSTYRIIRVIPAKEIDLMGRGEYPFPQEGHHSRRRSSAASKIRTNNGQQQLQVKIEHIAI
jgi:hypothetical protein